MTTESKLEAMLFAAGRPVAIKKLAEWLETDADGIKEALASLGASLGERGVGVVVHANEAELVTHPDAADLVRLVLKEETSGELTRPSLEALAVLAYRGPMTRPELEQIRGVQSSMILRNLMLRGLVEMKDESRLGQPLYQVTVDFLKHLGLPDLASLPDYESLHAHQNVEKILEELVASKTEETPTQQVDV